MNEPTASLPSPAPRHGTSLVDRVNLALHFRRYFKLLSRRWPILFLATVLGLGFSLYRASQLRDSFRATAELEVSRKLQVNTPNTAVMLDVMDSFYQDQLRVMNSGSLRARVLSLIRSSAQPLMEPPGTVGVAARGQGSSFRLEVTSPDLLYARTYASNWAQAFLQYKREQSEEILKNKQYTFQQDLFKQEKALDRARAEKEDYRKQHQIGSASDTYKAAQSQLEELKGALTSTQTKRRVLEQTPREALASGALAESRASLGSRNLDGGGGGVDMADPLSKFTADNVYVSLRSQLNTTLNTYNSLTNSLKPKHPEMVRLAKEMEKYKQQIAFQLQLCEDKRNAQLDSLKLTEQGMAQRIVDLSKQVQDLRGIQDEYLRLEEEEKRIEQTWRGIKDTLRQIELGPTDEAQFNTLGEIITSPENPHRSRVVLQGVGIGFLLGLALIYFLHRLDDRLELAEDIEEELQEPVLGQVPQVEMKSVKEGYLLITKLHRHNMFAEAIRGVRSAILLGSHEGKKQAMLVSSAVPGDGKTTFTVNFAATLAIAGNRVLLIDADLRRGNIHNYFGLLREPGLTEALDGTQTWREVVCETEIPTLQVITSGKLPAHPGELLVSPTMHRAMDEARIDYDYIVVDCPPLTAIDDAFSLIGLMDGLLFVVRSGQTSMRFAKTALAAVRQRGASILGIVLNGITADNPYYYYNYYYHAYYNKSSRDAQAEASEREASDRETGAKPEAVPQGKGRRLADKSISGEAMAIAGQRPSLRQIEKEAATKAELFKARRAARKIEPGSSADTSPLSAPSPGEQPGPSGAGLSPADSTAPQTQEAPADLRNGT